MLLFDSLCGYRLSIPSVWALKLRRALLFRQQEACTRFEAMSEKAKEELKLQRERRVQHFQKSLSELAELEASCLSLLPL
jgi:hypothetical protein